MYLPSEASSTESSANQDSEHTEQVVLTLQEYNAIQERLKRLKDAEADRIAQEERLRAELTKHESRAEALEQRFRESLREQTLAKELTGKSLVPGAASQLIKLWRDDFQVAEELGEYHVISSDGRSVTKIVTERLASPEFAHFCLPSSRGGSPPIESPRASGTPLVSPRTLGEAILAQWSQGTERLRESATSIGLGRR